MVSLLHTPRPCSDAGLNCPSAVLIQSARTGHGTSHSPVGAFAMPGMQPCLHPDVECRDIGFDLRGRQVFAMWHMTLSKSILVTYRGG